MDGKCGYKGPDDEVRQFVCLSVDCVVLRDVDERLALPNPDPIPLAVVLFPLSVARVRQLEKRRPPLVVRERPNRSAGVPLEVDASEGLPPRYAPIQERPGSRGARAPAFIGWYLCSQ